MQYKIGIYIRLSVADEDTGKAKAESDSVGNQKLLINRFLDGHKELSSCPRTEFVDDGYTGTNFHRPMFTRMMEMVRSGGINLICVKDFSRFSRDYIETGDYLECVFPFLGVRFISINDGYDSDNYKGTTGGLEVVMRSIIYATYSKDLSIKTTTAKIHMMKQGKYVGGYAPYGYTLHPSIRNKLAIDPDAASVVRRIFDEALRGRNTSRIAEDLNNDHIQTPGQYFRRRHPGNGKFSNMSDKISWTAGSVHNILTKYVYTGATVSHMRKSAGIGTKKSIAQKPEDWIIVEGMHDAIVTKEEFEQAQAVIRGGVKSPVRKNRDYPLRGLVRCGNCKRSMTRLIRKSGAVFHCAHSTADKETGCAVCQRYEETELEANVFDAISHFVSRVEDRAANASIKAAAQQSEAVQHLSSLKHLQTMMEQLKARKFQLYEQYSNGTITREAYLKNKTEFNHELAAVQENIQREEERVQALEDVHPLAENAAATACEMLRESDGLTFALAHEFLDAIYIYPDSRVELVWKVRNSSDDD